MTNISSKKLWRKLKQIKGTKKATSKALLLYYVLEDKTTPLWVKGIVVVALGYLINPADPLGIDPFILIDDIAVLSTAIASASTAIKPMHYRQAEKHYHSL